MKKHHRPDFRLGEWVFRPSRNRLEGPHGEFGIEPKMTEVLWALLEESGRIATRDELLARAWPDTHVTDDVLTRCVAELRKCFRDDPHAPHMIETVPRVGYRLLVRAEEFTDDAPQEPVRARSRLIPVAAALVAAVSLSAWALVGIDSHRADPVQARQITSFPGLELDPAVAPDGDRLAFARRSADGTEQHVWIAGIRGEAPRQLTRGPGLDSTPTWSPNGNHLAFVRTLAQECWVMLIRVKDASERSLAQCRHAGRAGLAWSPDGTAIVIGAGRRTAAGSALQWIDAVSGASLPTEYPPAQERLADIQPRFAPDGSVISFTRILGGDGRSDLFSVTLATGEARRLTHDRGTILGHTWRNEDRIVFAAWDSGSSALWELTPGEEPRWIPLTVAGRGPSAEPDTGAVVFEVRSHEQMLVELPPGGAPRPLFPSAADDGSPRLSSTGRLAFVSSRTGTPEVWLAEANAKALARTSLAARNLLAPTWSPDGRKLAFAASVTGDFDVYVLEQGAADPRRLRIPGSNEMYPSWSHDGNEIVVASDREGAFALYRMAPNDTRMEPLGIPHGLVSASSQDGRWLYFTRWQEPGLWRAPWGRFETGDAIEKVAPDPAIDSPLGWALHDGRLYVSRHMDGSAQILRIEPGSGGEQIVADLPGTRLGPGLTVRANGTILLTQRIRHESDLWIIDPGS